MYSGQAFDAIAKTVSATTTKAIAGNRIKKNIIKQLITQIFITLLGQGRFIASVLQGIELRLDSSLLSSLSYVRTDAFVSPFFGIFR
jgi:hypothetical protein